MKSEWLPKVVLLVLIYVFMSEIISNVFNIDCLEYMKTLPDKYFDLCIADPPYGINIQKSGRLMKYNKQWVDDKIPTNRYLMKCLDVAKMLLYGGAITF